MSLLMRNDWTDDRILDEHDAPHQRSRNPDSSVDPQYEDSVAPDSDSDHEPS